MSGTAAVMAGLQVDTGYIVGLIIGWVVSHVITGAVTGWVTLKILQRQVERMEDRLTGLDAVHHALKQTHHACQLDARDRYCTRRELINVIADNNQHYQSLMDRMDKGFGEANERVDDTHNRITAVDRRLSAIEGREEA